MKVLDAEQLHAGIQETITVLLQLKKQLDQIEQNLQSFISLEGELKGEGGKSIRSFYQESHLPFLTYMKDTIDQYEAILLEMRNALRSLEPSGQGFIRQSFIENDVEQGLRKAETITRDLTGEGNATIQSVSDIVSLPRLNEGDFIQQANRAGSHADQTLQKLHQFDRSQSSKLEKVDQDLRTLNRTVTEIKSLFQTGKLSISQYKPTQLAMELSGLTIPNFSQFLAYGPASIHLGTNEMLMKAETFRIAGTEVKDVKESQSSMGWLSTTLDFVPGVSNIKAGVEAISGKDFITGREIGYLERGALVAAIFGGPIVKGATKVVKWGGKHLSKLKNVFNPDKIKAVIDDALKAVTKGFNTLRNTAAHLSEKISNIRIPTWQPAYATPNGTPIQPTTLGEAADGVKKQIVSMAGKVKDGVGRGVGKDTYQHLKDYKNNKYFTRSVEYNAGKDGTGFTYKVYQRGDINWDLVRTKGAKKGRGLTNAEASAKYGLAPILDDAGSVATLHHSQQKGVGPLYEASTRYHNISNAKRAPLHPYKGKLNPFYPMDETTRGAFQKVDSINYWKIRGEEALGGK